LPRPSRPKTHSDPAKDTCWHTVAPLTLDLYLGMSHAPYTDLGESYGLPIFVLCGHD
jgi:hypothetical protein